MIREGDFSEGYRALRDVSSRLGRMPRECVSLRDKRLVLLAPHCVIWFAIPSLNEKKELHEV